MHCVFNLKIRPEDKTHSQYDLRRLRARDSKLTRFGTLKKPNLKKNIFLVKNFETMQIDHGFSVSTSKTESRVEIKESSKLKRNWFA